MSEVELAEREVELSERIVATAGVCGGRPRIKGTRVRVTDILAALGAGDTADQIVESLPWVTHADIIACLNYAAWRMEERVIAAVE